MKSKFYPLTVFFLLLYFGLSAQIYEPEGLNMPGSWDGWNNPPTINALANPNQKTGGLLVPIATGTRRWHTTIHCANSGGDVAPGSYEFLFTSGPSSNYFKNKWANVTVTMNTLQTYTYGGATNNAITLADGKWYTVNWEDKGYVDTRAIFMETSAAPVTISTVSQLPLTGDVSDNDAVTVTIITSAAPSPEEHIYVRYSTDNWATSSLAAVSFTGSTGTATIPAQSAETAVSYYVFSTTVSNPSADYDLLTIDYNNNGGSNYSYTVKYGTTAAGDWNNTSTWRAGTVPASNNDVVISHAVNVTNAVSSPAVCDNLTINAGASLTIGVGDGLTVNGNLTNNAAASGLTISSDATGNGSLIVNGTVTGSATVQRYIPQYTSSANGWHEISSPVNAMAISGSGFEPGSSDDLYAWDEVNDIWSNYRQSDGSHPFSTFANGEGYLVAYSSTATKNFTGTLNNADITFSNLSYNTTQGNGWHLLGNPFSSALTWGDANWSLTNVGGVAKVWNESGGNYSDISSGGIIPSTNGFFVQVTNTTNSLTIPAADRVHNAANNYKSASATRQAGTLQFKVTSDANGYYDESRLGFKPNATEGFDPAFDSHKLFTMVQTAPSLWTVSKKQDFSTDYIPEPATAYDVPLHFKPGVSTVYHLSVKGVDSFNGTSFVLEDLKTGDKIDLGTTKEYDFSAEKGDDPNRFVLHINGVTGIPDVDGTEGLHIFSYGKTIYLDSQKALNGKVTVYNLMGQKVYESPLNGTGKQQFRLDRQQGVYFVKVEEEGLTRTHKVFIK